MLHFLLGTAGSGKTNRIRHCIAERVKNGESGIVLLTPEQYTFESERALLQLLGATAADRAEVLSFTKMVEYIGTDAECFSKPHADTGTRAVAVKRAIAGVHDELRVLCNVKLTPEFILSMLDIITELKQCNVTGDMLYSSSLSADNKAFADKMHDISLIMSAYESILGERYIDPDDDLMLLCSVLDSSNYFCGKTVYIDAFDGFTLQQYKILERIIATAKDVYASFCTDSLHDDKMGTGVFSNVKREIARFTSIAKSNNIAVAKPEMLVDSVRFENDELKTIERIMRGEFEVTECDCDKVTICEASTLYDEVDYAARTIKKLVRTDGYRYRDFTIIVRSMDDYRHIFDSAFGRYEIPCYLDKRADNSDLMLLSYVFNMLKTASMGFSRENIFSLIKSPLSPFTVDEAALLENYSFIWNIKSSDWHKRWEQNPNGMDAPNDDEKLELINSVRERVLSFVSPLRNAVNDGETRKICGEIYNTLIKWDAASKIKEYAQQLQEQGNLYLSELQYKSWDFLMDTLDKMTESLGKYTTPHELVDTFELLLRCDNLGTIPSRIDEVMIGDAYRIRPCDPKVVFVLGANYREMPKPYTEKGILTLRDREKLMNCGIELGDRAEAVSVKERYAVYSSVCCASERVYITYHSFDKSNAQSVCSDFVAQLLKYISGLTITNERDSRMDKFESAASAYEFIAENYDTVDCDFDRFESDILKNSFAVINSTRCGISDSISHKTAAKLYGNELVLSPSHIEQFSKCPFSSFCRYDLKVKPITQAQINAVQRGTIAHYVLEKTIKKYVGKLSELSDQQLDNEIRQCISEYLKLHFAGFDTDDKKFIFTIERISVLLFEILRNIGEELNQTAFSPVMFEQKISVDGDVKPMDIPFNGGSVKVIGTVDRVDIMKKDDVTYVRVIDYKTGSKEFAISNILYGLNLQMLLYLYTLVDSKKFENAKCAGVLYMPVRRSEFKPSDSDSDNRSFTMKGVINSDDGIPESMEHDGKGKYVPFTYGSKGDYKSSSLIDGNDFDSIRSFVVKKVSETGERILDGDISCKPLMVNNNSVCTYCDYKTVCTYSADAITVKNDKNALDYIRKEAAGDEFDK